MKRTVFIISGVVLVLVLIAVWIYVLFFGTPKNLDNNFADLTIGDTTDTNYTPSDANEETTNPVVNIFGQKALQQLTTKPIVGYSEVIKTASSTPEVYYIEAGTGHVYSINTTTGEERRVSVTTFPSSQKGEITPDGKFVMIQSGSGVGREFTVGEIGSSSDNNLITHTINEPIVDFTSTSEDTFLYAVQTASSVVGKSYNPSIKKEEILFTIPFREVAIDWGATADSVHYAYPKASTRLEGAVYKIEAGKINRLPVDGFGLSARSSESVTVFGKQENNKYQTYTYDQVTGNTNNLIVNTIPEKCTFGKKNENTVYCAATFIEYGSQLPDTWYRGEVSYQDSLWEIDTKYGGAGLLTDTLIDSGQELDIINIQTSQTEREIYFVNKNNQTLWMYNRVPNLTE